MANCRNEKKKQLSVLPKNELVGIIVKLAAKKQITTSCLPIIWIRLAVKKISLKKPGAIWIAYLIKDTRVSLRSSDLSIC